jgi:hypothetical protein
MDRRHQPGAADHQELRLFPRPRVYRGRQPRLLVQCCWITAGIGMLFLLLKLYE